MFIKKLFHFIIKRVLAIYLLFYSLYNLSRTNDISRNAKENFDIIGKKCSCMNSAFELIKEYLFNIIAIGNIAIFYGAIIMIINSCSAKLFLSFGFLIDLLLNSKLDLINNENGFNKCIGYITMIGLCLEL